jgi:hypothetical protein
VPQEQEDEEMPVADLVEVPELQTTSPPDDPRWIAIRRFGKLLFLVSAENPAIIKVWVKHYGQQTQVTVNLLEALSGGAVGG